MDFFYLLIAPVDYKIWSIVQQRVYQSRVHNTDKLAVLQKRNASINKRYKNARKKFKETHKNNLRKRMNSSIYVCLSVNDELWSYTARAMLAMRLVALYGTCVYR